MIRAAVMADAPQLAALMTQLGYSTQVKEMRKRLPIAFSPGQKSLAIARLITAAVSGPDVSSSRKSRPAKTPTS